MVLHPVSNKIPVVLSLAGYDPSSGAGITADIKTIAAHKCYGVTCITSLTVQSTRGVRSVEPVEGRFITETLEELTSDLQIAAIKIGMLGSAEAARAVAGFLKRHQPRNVVLDPVLKSSSGADLISHEAFQFLQQRIIGMALIITPNADEAAVLTGLKVSTVQQMEIAAAGLRRMGARNVIVTGGHLDPPCDVMSLEARRDPVILNGVKVASRSTHGTGCAFSTSLACRIALGKNLVEAARGAKNYVESALKKAPLVGRGVGPVV